MPSILVLGATGYIGQAVSSALIRSGNHTVYGLARSEEKAKVLNAQEIIPVLGSVSDSAKYLELIGAANIDIVIDVAGANKESKQILEDLKVIGKERLQRAAATGVKSPKLGFIYASGIWVHGSSSRNVNDLTPVGVQHAPTQPPTLVAWRPLLEQEILAASDVLDTMIIRPALVYGRAGAIWSGYFGPLVEAARTEAEKVSIAAELDSRPPLVHVDDVATGFLAAVEKLPLIAGTGVYPVFDLITSQESMRDILEEAARNLGFTGQVHLSGAGDNLFMQAMSVSVNGNSSRAVNLLGWKPMRFGMVQKMDVVAQAWLATQS